MSYQLAAWYDPLVSAFTEGAARAAEGTARGVVETAAETARGAVQATAESIAEGMTPAIVKGVREVLPQVQATLSTALSEGFAEITRKNRATFTGFGIAIGLFTIGSLGLMYAQYRQLQKCCPRP